MSQTEKKRIILVATNDLTTDQRLHKMAVSLQKHGWEPKLLGRYLSGSVPLKRLYDTKRFRLLFNAGPLFYLCFNIRSLVYLLFARADLMVSNDLDTLPGVWLAARIRKKPLIYDSHEYFTEVPELVNRKRKKGIWKRIERMIQPKLKYVITVNESIADLFREEYNQDVTVIKNLPDRERIEMIPGNLPEGFRDKPIIIYQGAVNVGRGIEELLGAMVYLTEFNLVIAGGGDILDNIKDLTEKKGLSGRVCFTGKLPFEKLCWFTSQADIGISLEQDIGLNYRLSLPNKLFDYMSAGLPVVASDLPEISKLVENVGFGILVSDYTPQSLGRQIKNLWDDKVNYRKYSENALKNAPIYSWSKQEEILINIYQKALESGK